MKHLYILILCGLICATNVSGQVVISGNSTWTLTYELTGTPGNYTLNIGGTGDMSHYCPVCGVPNYPGGTDYPRWYSYRHEITRLNIAEGVTGIGGYAFYEFSSITSVSIPNSVIRIEKAAFYNCSSLTDVSIGNSVQYLTGFGSCSSLKSVNIPNSVTVIGSDAFRDCSSLTEITIPESVSTIEGSAFTGCTGLTEVISLNPVPPIFKSADYGVFSSETVTTCPLRVPAASVAAYRAADKWKSFKKITTLEGIILVSGVSLNMTATTLGVGEAQTLTALVKPVDANDQTIKWISDNPGVATVSSNGAVTGVAAGTAVITVTAQDGGYTAQCKVTVVTRPVTQVTINGGGTSRIPLYIKLVVGAEEKLIVAVLPDNATNKAVTWSSSNTAIAAVSDDGTVTGIAPGSAEITVTTQDGGKTAKCTVTVGLPVSGITLDKTTVTLGVGLGTKITANVLPSNVINYTTTWSSSNTAVASLSGTGTSRTVKGEAVGTAIITATTEEGGKTAQCIINVVQPVTGITLNKTTTTLIVGTSETLTAAVLPENATDKTVSWSSNKPTVSAVDNNGIVKGIAPGSAVITATTQDGNRTARCTVTVADVSFTVTFETNGGNPAPAPQTVVKSSKIKEPVIAPALEGYLFGGWYSEPMCIIDWDFARHTVDKDITLYAKWIPFCQVSFETIGTPVPVSQNVATGSTVVRPSPDPKLVGYRFDGWYSDEACNNLWDFSKPVYASMKLYAKWIQLCTVTFDTKGGIPLDTPKNVDKGDIVKEPTFTPELAGYKFGGWYSDKACNNPWNFSNPVNASMTLYAKWILLHKVTLYWTDGESGTSGKVTEVKVEHNTPANLPIPTRQDYEFAGWYITILDGRIMWDINNNVTEDLTLYAYWERAFTVTFDSKGGNPVPPPQTVKEENKATEPIAPTRDGYTFDGWYKEVAYVNVGMWNFDEKISEDMTLCASWKEIPEVTKVEVLPDRIIMRRGQTMRFTAKVDASSGVSKDVTWSIRSLGHTSSINPQTGLLSISNNETSSILIVVAKSVFDPTVSGSSNVMIPVSLEDEVAIKGSVKGVPAGTEVQLYESTSGITKAAVPEGYSYVASTTTDASGNYLFDHLSPGVYIVLVVMPGCESEPTAPITLVKGETVDEINFAVKGNTIILDDNITGTEDLFVPDMKLYPNPFLDLLHLSGSEGCTLRVFNAVGIVVHVQKVDNPNETLRLEHLPAGVYFFRLEKDGKAMTVKAVKN